MTTTPTGTPPGDDGSIPPGSMAELAVADLVERLGVEPTDVTVVGSESVTWSDGSLGCPEPGMSYTQALVPGHRVVLTVDGATYEYHSGRDAAPFWCPPDRIRPPVDGAAAGT